MSCQPFFLKSIKLENDYKQAKETFQERQGCSNSTTQTNLDSSCEEFNPVGSIHNAEVDFSEERNFPKKGTDAVRCFNW